MTTIADTTTELLDHAIAIAAELGDGWHAVPHRDTDEARVLWIDLTHPSGRTLHVSSCSWPPADRDKYRVSAEGPRDADNTEERPRSYGDDAALPVIRFARTKSATQAARDIARRILPTYLPLWDTLKARIDERESYRTERACIAREVAALVGGTVEQDREKLATVRLPYSSAARVRSVEFGSGHEIRVVLNLQSLNELRDVLAGLHEPTAQPKFDRRANARA